MKVKELFSAIRNVLQDNDKDYWDDSELLDYYNECKRTMASERLEVKTTADMLLDPLQSDYSTDGILRYIKAKDDDGNERKLYPNDSSGDDDSYGVIIKDYNKVYVNNPELGTKIIFDIVTMPSEDNYESDVRLGDENAFKYYILSKAYEKETDMENFQKSEFFYAKYVKEFSRLISASSVNYRTSSVTTTEGSYF